MALVSTPDESIFASSGKRGEVDNFPIYCVVWEFALNEIARATLQQYGIVQLSSATNSDSETEAATSKAVKPPMTKQ